MTRVTRGFVAKKRRKRVLKLAKGFRGSHSVLFRTAQQRTMRALSLAYRDRRLYKRDIRSLWIRRINSFLHDTEFHGGFAVGGDGAKSSVNSAASSKESLINTSSKRSTSYSSFIHQLKKSNILLNRKVLAQLSIFDPLSMKKITEIAAMS